MKSTTHIYLLGENVDWKIIPLNQDEQNYCQEQFAHQKKRVFYFNRLGHFDIVLLAEAGKDRSSTLEKARAKGNEIGQTLNQHKFTEAHIVDLLGESDLCLALAEGIALGSYQFIRYKSNQEKETHTLEQLYITSKRVDMAQISRFNTLIESVYMARDLVNEPLSTLNAEALGQVCLHLSSEVNIKTEVFNERKIESLKMGGLLAVNKGSIDPPVFIVMEYKPKKPVNKKPIVFVGKGVVYDTGGLSLKPTPGSMDSMKCDMAGAAAAIAALYAVAKSELPVHLVTLVPATDNRPDGNAIVPGDVITISDNTTVEVLNTDAEGRLILSDALVYAQKYDPELVIDLATLTGAASRAIGHVGIVAMTNHAESYQKLKQSGDQVYERLVEFPLWDEYADMIKSDIADVKNIGGVVAGANTAGKFLERFTKYPWIHLDIAGPAFLDFKDGYRGKGGTGVGVRLLFDFIKSRCEI